MVGVPRSKGCRICVQRRVRCDQTRPTCNNCKKGNRPCPGYGQDLKFQDEGERLRKRFANDGSAVNVDATLGGSPPDLVNSTTGSSPHESDVQATGEYSEAKEWDVVGLDMNVSQRRTFMGLLEGKRHKYISLDDITPETKIDLAFEPESVPELIEAGFNGNSPAFLAIPHYVCSPEINQNQLLTVFKNSCFPDQQQNVIPAMRYHSRWLEHLPPMTGTNSLLDTSVRAVTLVHLGRLNDSEVCINESRPYYGKALRMLTSALMDKEKGMSSETLCATILLSFYEMFASNNNESWVRHAGGAGALVKMRGPERHRFGFDREIFLAYRYTLIIDAFQADVPCFLDEPQWRQLADNIHSDIKGSGVIQRPEVFDLAEAYYKTMLPLPGLCSEARNVWNNYQAGKALSHEYVEDLIHRTKGGVSTFRSGFEGLEAAIKRAGHAPTFNVSKDPVISVSYSFQNIFVASVYTGYWTCSSVMNLCLQGMETQNPEALKIYHAENREHALNICRSTSFMLTSSFLGPFFLIFGLRVALNVFEDSEGVECDWVLEKLFKIGDRHMGMAKHVPGYQAGMTLQELLAENHKHRSQRREETLNHGSGWLSEIAEANSPFYADLDTEMPVLDVDV